MLCPRISIFAALGLYCLTISCIRLPQRTLHLSDHPAGQFAQLEATLAPSININTATQEELEKLPGIGPALAARIIEHRERYGRFRRPEHLIMVRGISERRFEQMRAFIKVE